VKLQLLDERLDVGDEGRGTVFAVRGPGALAVATLIERQEARPPTTSSRSTGRTIGSASMPAISAASRR
jgi:hypothetical protein